MPSTIQAGTKLSIQQAVDYARAAGFTEQAKLITIVAIAMGESSLDTHAINHSDPYGGSFGVLQINGAHFGDRFGPGGIYVMSQQTAFDPALSFIFGWELSKQGTNFRPWGAFTDGRYYQYIEQVRAVVLQGTGLTSQPLPPYTGTPWYNYSIYSDYPWSDYHNTDVGTPPDIPITASLAGTITMIGYYDWGGSITIKVDQPSLNNGYKDYFVIHLDALNPALKKGMHVKQGTFLGYSGGENSLNDARLKPLPPGYSHHVTSPQHSTGPHLDIGTTNSDTGTLVDNTAAGKSASDHLVLLARQLHINFGTGDTSGDSGPTQDTNQPPITIGPINISGYQTYGQMIHHTLVQWPGMYGIAAALDEASTFPGFINEVPQIDGPTDWQDIGAVPGAVVQSVFDTFVWNSIPFFVRGLMIIMGLFLIFALLWQLAKPNLEALPELLKLGAIAAI